MGPAVLLEKPEPGIAVVRLNRPDDRNALNAEVRKLINGHFKDLSDDPDVRCVVLAGNKTVFAAGGDIKEFGTRDSVDSMRASYTVELSRCRKPVIAAVNGYALGGGCEYAMQCDIVVASEGAKFGQPEVRLGLVPGAGGTQRLPRSIGRYKALWMLLTGNSMTARQAFDAGLVSELVPDDAEPRAMELARQIAALPPITVQQIKEIVHAGLNMPLDGALQLEMRSHQLMFSTQDVREGTAAFIEKRKPEFKGR